MKMCRIALSVPLFLLCMSGIIVCAEDIEVEPSVEPLITGMDDSLQRIIDLHGKATVEFILPVLKHSNVSAGKFAGKQLTKREEIEWFSINEKYRFSQQIQNFIDGKLVEEPVAYAGPQFMPRENWECCDNGEGTLEYQPDSEQAHIKSSNRSMMNTDSIKMLVDPSYYGLKILGRTLKELSLGKDLPKNESSDQFKEIRKTFKLVGQEKHEGSICQIVQYSKQWQFNKNNYKYVYNIWVDVERNFTIPKVFGFLFKNDKEFPTLEVNSTMQETTGGFWMPRESFVTRTIYPKTEDTPLKQRTHIKFANISVNSGLSETDLKISIPPGTTIIDEILGTVYRISNAPEEAFDFMVDLPNFDKKGTDALVPQLKSRARKTTDRKPKPSLTTKQKEASNEGGSVNPSSLATASPTSKNSHSIYIYMTVLLLSTIAVATLIYFNRQKQKCKD